MSKRKRKERQNPGWANRMLELFSGLEEFINGSDRVSVILGVAQLDVALERILIGLLTSKERAQKELFASGGIGLSSFSAKINIAFHLGLISVNFQKSLHLVRKIRNDAAHDQYPFRLDSDTQTDRVNELKRRISPSFEFTETFQVFNLSQFQDEALNFRTSLLALSFKLDELIRAVWKYDYNLGVLLNDNKKFELKCPVEISEN